LKIIVGRALCTDCHSSVYARRKTKASSGQISLFGEIAFKVFKAMMLKFIASCHSKLVFKVRLQLEKN
ncbi:hypothetical protein WDZ92_35265, partial [Nostoc sp. NIES-2111]